MTYVELYNSMVYFGSPFNRLNLLEVERSRWTKEKGDLELQLNCKAEKLETMKESLLSTTAKLQSLQNQREELDEQIHELNGCVRKLKYVQYDL